MKEGEEEFKAEEEIVGNEGFRLSDGFCYRCEEFDGRNVYSAFFSILIYQSFCCCRLSNGFVASGPIFKSSVRLAHL